MEPTLADIAPQIAFLTQLIAYMFLHKTMRTIDYQPPERPDNGPHTTHSYSL